MAQAARPSLTVAQLHTPLTNIPTLAHALTRGDGQDKAGIHQLLSGFAERADGKTWDFTVSRKRSRNNNNKEEEEEEEGEEEPSNEEDASDGDASPSRSAPATPTGRHRPSNKRQRLQARAASPSFDERQGEVASETLATRGRAVDGSKNKNNNCKKSAADYEEEEDTANSDRRSSRSRRKRVAPKRTPRVDRRRKSLKFDEGAEEAGEKSEDKERSEIVPRAGRPKVASVEQLPLGQPTPALLPEGSASSSSFTASLSLVGEDGRYDPSRLYHIPVARRHSLIFPLLHTPEYLEQRQHHYDDSQYDYARISDYEHNPVPLPIAATSAYPPLPVQPPSAPFFAVPPPTPPPPPTGPWYSLLIDDSIPTPPPPPPPLNLGQASLASSTTASPQRQGGGRSHHYPPSPSMPLSSPEYNPYRSPSPHTVPNSAEYQWSWLSDACEDEILWFLRSTPGLAQPQPQPRHHQHLQLLQPQASLTLPARAEFDARLLLAEIDEAGLLTGESDGLHLDAADQGRPVPMTSLVRPVIMRLREAAAISASPAPLPSWVHATPTGTHSGAGAATFGASVSPHIDALSRLPGSGYPHNYRTHAHYYGHSSMPSSASSSHPSSPHMVDMEIPYTATALPTFDLPVLASPLLLPTLGDPSPLSTSTTPTATPTLRSTSSSRRRSGCPSTTTTAAASQAPKRKNARRLSPRR